MIVLLLLITAVLAGLITIGGWSVLQGGSGMGIVCAIYAILYAFFAFLVARWRRGILPVAAALSMILAIFCAVGADSWFARDKAGFSEAALSSSAVGVLVIVLAVVQLVVIVAALYGFNQGWNIEEERPIGNGEDYGAGAPAAAAPRSPPEPGCTLMPEVGLEPTSPQGQSILSRSRMPIPPLRRVFPRGTVERTNRSRRPGGARRAGRGR